VDCWRRDARLAAAHQCAIVLHEATIRLQSYDTGDAKPAQRDANDEQQETDDGNETYTFNTSRAGDTRERPGDACADDKRSHTEQEDYDAGYLLTAHSVRRFACAIGLPPVLFPHCALHRLSYIAMRVAAVWALHLDPRMRSRGLGGRLLTSIVRHAVAQQRSNCLTVGKRIRNRLPTRLPEKARHARQGPVFHRYPARLLSLEAPLARGRRLFRWMRYSALCASGCSAPLYTLPSSTRYDI
jgi:GNAT superfamily N-acetyltransferase